MLIAALFFLACGLGLIGWGKSHDGTEAYEIVLPMAGGVLCLLMAGVLSIIHWVF